MADKYISKSEEDTIEIAESLAKGLKPQSRILLTGTLGSGKTVFVKGLVKGLGGDLSRVLSPTFTIVKEYSVTGAEPAAPADKRPLIERVFHIDLYRLEPEDVGDIDLSLYLNDLNAVVVVEWAEKLPEDARKEIMTVIESRAVRIVKIRHRPDDVREIEIKEASGD